MLEKIRKDESLPPPPIPFHSNKLGGSRMFGANIIDSDNNQISRPSARPRQRQLAPKYVNSSDSRIPHLSSIGQEQAYHWKVNQHPVNNRSSSAFPKSFNFGEDRRSPSANKSLRHILQRFNSPKRSPSLHADFEEPAFSWRRHF